MAEKLLWTTLWPVVKNVQYIFQITHHSFFFLKNPPEDNDNGGKHTFLENAKNSVCWVILLSFQSVSHRLPSDFHILLSSIGPKTNGHILFHSSGRLFEISKISRTNGNLYNREGFREYHKLKQ